MQFNIRSQRLSFFYHLTLMSVIAIVFCLVVTQAAFAAFPTDWSYRKSHVINSAAGAGTDYQVRIIAHWGNGTDSGEDVYFDGKCQANFDDIRFVSSDGTTELDFWMETGSLTTGLTASAVFWVEVADDLSTASQTIYVYYGNASETTASDGDDTFIFFDDFDGDLSKWTIEKTLDGGFIAIQPGDFLRCGGGQTSGTYGHTSIGSSPTYGGYTDGAIEVRLKQSANALAEIVCRGDFGANTGYKARFDSRTGSESPHMKPPYYNWQPFGTAVTRFGIGTDTWFRGTLAVTSSGGSFTGRIFRNDVLMATGTDIQYPGPGEIALQNHYGSYSDYDWVAVRKYVYPEPVHDVWGLEETLAANVYATKSVALSNDADGNGVITPGDTMRYNVKIYNTGNVAALGTALTDLLPAETTYTGSWTATNGTVTHSAGQISWTGYVTADPTGVIKTEITFDVTVNSGTPLLTVVSNQGTVSYDSVNDGVNDTDILTDGDPFVTGIQTTDFTVGGSAQATGTKTAVLAVDADGNGVITPGDTLEYEIIITNKTGFSSDGIEVSDVIPPHTTYVVGSTIVADRDGTSTIVEPSPPTYPEPLLITGITIGPAGSGSDVVTIKFRVLLDDPMASGVTQISNQAVGFYDSNSDGINDTYQATDGDPGTLGNQPTVSDLYIGTISGTVFDDNGAGGGTGGDGIQNGAETGISGVTVSLYDSLFASLYGDTITDFDGYFIFTALTPGDYGVRETDPDYYVSTTPNDISPVTLDASPSTGDSAVVNYGDQVNGNADLELSKICGALLADGTDQLAFHIAITNNGPDVATNVVLTDDLDALVTAGLSNLNYTEDGGALTPWPGTNSLTWASMAADTSHVIRIYATVDPAFVPAENTASVISDIYDPLPGTNGASCTNLIYTPGRGALEFDLAGNTSVTVPSDPAFEFGDTGTMEAWIYPTTFIADAGILIKGTTAACYGFGLGGGGVGDVFSEGTAQNIGFVLYDTSGTKYLLTADTYTLSAYQWVHIACVWDLNASPKMAIYINGIKQAENSLAIADVRTNTEDLVLGFQNITAGNLSGIIDEVRVWDSARLQARLQDTLCHRISSAESDYTDLAGNWRFDEGSGVVCNDASGYGNMGYTNAQRVCSAAPVGDASVHDYTGSTPAEFQVLNFASSYGDNMTVTGEGGEWNSTLDSCLHVYRVDAPPESYGQPLFWKSLGLAPHYWGVFKSGGTDPTYEVVYTYTGYPFTNENGLNLAYRSNNCESWKSANATLDTGFETLTQTGFSGTEFILGQNVDPRNAINFDSSSNQYVQVADGGDLDPTTVGAIEAWINLSSFQPNAGIIHKGDGSTDSYSLYMNGVSNDQVFFTVDDGSSPVTINSTITLGLNTWYHVAGTWDGTNMNLYINGIQEATIATAISAQNSAGSLYIGARQAASTTYFDGIIDEVRVWTVARSQTDIRNTMCQKLAGTETGLGGYWRFDEETDSATTPDYDAGTANDGIMIGWADGAAILAGRVCSPAPIGDDSAYDYTATTTSANLAHPDGDDMTASQFGGNWNDTYTGIQVYRVDEAPVYPPDIATVPYAYGSVGLTPPPGWSSIDYYRYWGVFVTDWINTPSYQVVYNYDGNPSVPTDESELGLAIREQYCDRTWADTGAAPDTGANTLTHTGETIIDEYVLGGKNQPLAIALASFYAEFDKSSGDCIKITWETATEVDTVGFQIWRSDTEDGPYILMPGSFQASKSVSGTTGATYSYSDCDADLDTYMTFYYKLEEIDLDNTRDNPFYGPIGPVTETVSASQFSRGNTPKANSGGCFIGALE